MVEYGVFVLSGFVVGFAMSAIGTALTSFIRLLSPDAVDSNVKINWE